MLKANVAILMDSIDGLRHISTLRYPPKISWDLAKLIRKCNEILKEFSDMRDTIVRRNGMPVGNEIVVTEEKRKDYTDEVLELLKEEVEIDMRPFNLADVLGFDKNSSDAHIEPKYLISLDWIFGETEVITDTDKSS